MSRRSVEPELPRTGLEISRMSISAPSVLGSMPTNAEANGKKPFVPKAVTNFEEAGLNPAMIESLVLKFLVQYRHGLGPADRRRAGLAVRPVPRFPPPAQEPAVRGLRQLGVGQRLHLLADRHRADARQDLLRGMRLRRDRRRCRSTTISSRSPRRRSRPSIPRKPTCAGRSPTC